MIETSNQDAGRLVGGTTGVRGGSLGHVNWHHRTFCVDTSDQLEPTSPDGVIPNSISARIRSVGCYSRRGHALLCEVCVRFCRNNLSQSLSTSLITRNGGEVVAHFDYSNEGDQHTSIRSRYEMISLQTEHLDDVF